MAYKAELPPDVKLPEGYSINTADPRYKALEELATREGMSQSTFSNLLGIEGRRVNAEYERARAAAPAPAPAAAPAAKPDFSKMSAREQMAYSLAHGSTRSNRGG
jgi:hypothetical protein